MNGVVRALAVYDGKLVAAGAFSTAGGIAVGRIAQWDGSAWAALGAPGLNSAVHALAVWNGTLVAGGQFSRAGPDSLAVNRTAQWDGTAWRAVKRRWPSAS